MSQTSVVNKMVEGLEGQLFDIGFNDIISKRASVAIPFGRLVSQATLADECKLPTVATDITTAKNVLGIAVRTQAIESSASGDPSYLIKDMVNVLKRGRLYVKVEQDVVVGDDVFVRYAAGGNGLGSFGNTAGTSERGQLAGAKWSKGALTGGFAVVDINLP